MKNRTQEMSFALAVRFRATAARVGINEMETLRDPTIWFVAAIVLPAFFWWLLSNK
jgi:hypothetical protein